jgi:Lrp/AsnC family transcriptional regulator, leucine-responsive regulatory protein
MKLGNGQEMALDAIDLEILQTLQEDCKIPLARIGDRVGLSAPSVIERIKKLEQAGVVRGYHAVLDSRRVGLDVTAFIGVLISQPPEIQDFEGTVSALEGVLECHHVTGGYTLLLKVKTQNTSSLEQLISQVRGIPGVTRTETMVVLSTHTERSQVPLLSHPAHAPESVRRRTGRGAAVIA